MDQFADYVIEVLGVFAEIKVKPMFGGYGVYHENLMFGIIADDVLYLKADGKSAKLFIDKNLTQFEYFKKGKPVKMSYYIAPAELFEDPDQAKIWATCAYEAAMRSTNRDLNHQGTE